MIHDIAVIAPDKDLLVLFESIRQETPIDFTLHEGLLEESLEVANQLIQQGAKVLVSRGETTTQLRAAGITVPIVDIPITVHDVIPLIDQARHYSSRIAVVGFGAVIRAAEVVAPILSVQLDIFRLTSAREIPAVVQDIKDKGYAVLVGTPRAAKVAGTLGMKGFHIRSQAPVLLATLAEAEKLAEVVRRENEWRLRQQAFIESSNADVLFLDNQGRALRDSPQARLDDRFAGVLFDPAAPELPLRHPDILAAVRRGGMWRGELRDTRGAEYQCRVLPVAYEGRNFGAMVLLESLRRDAGAQRTVFQKGLVASYHFEDIIHAGPAMQEIIATAKRYAAVESNVLILGESGTGKELVAQSLHNASRRRHGPFVAINCAALPEQLLESELFGYQGGAFTGARREGRVGLFELANGGTLFLDEIGEMSQPMQAKLLRTIEERNVIRVGGDRVIPVDLRLISATNRNLGQLVRSNRFHQDLYFRINVLRIALPPLRSRGECLPVLIRHFLKEISKDLSCPAPGVHPQAMAKLLRYPFPGNVRELKNLLERLVVTCGDSSIGPGDVKRQMEDWLPTDDAPGPRPRGGGGGELLRQEEMRLIRKVLDECRGNRTQAARKLGISTATLWRRLRRGAADA